MGDSFLAINILKNQCYIETFRGTLSHIWQSFKSQWNFNQLLLKCKELSGSFLLQPQHNYCFWYLNWSSIFVMCKIPKISPQTINWNFAVFADRERVNIADREVNICQNWNFLQNIISWNLGVIVNNHSNYNFFKRKLMVKRSKKRLALMNEDD